MANLSVIGTNVQRVDAVDKVTGKAKFCSDFKIPGTLHARIVKSPYPHAKILRIDVSKAKKLPGVRAIVLPEDVPDVYLGGCFFDELALPKDNIVRCIGQAVAAVAADTADIAEEALELIKVDYEELPAVFDAEEALSQNPPAVVHTEMTEDSFISPYCPWVRDLDRPNCVNHTKIREGDVDKGFNDADIIIENRFSTDKMAYSAIETHRVDAWVEADGTLTWRAPSQTAGNMRGMLAMLFGVPISKTRVIAPYIGGGFGGKVCPELLLASIAMFAAIKSGRPVHLENKRSEEFVGGRHRGNTITYIKDGVKKDGTLVAREMKVILNVGRHAGMGQLLSRNMAFGAVGTYKIPNLKWDSYGVYTNNPIVGAFRGFGAPEVTWAIEQQMDILAEKLGIDPVEIRRKNILKEGDKDACTQKTVAIGARGCLDKAAAWIESEKKPESEGVWKRGKGIAIGNKYCFSAPACVTVKVHPDGKLEARHGNVEMGQGLNTVIAQITAEEFGVSVDDVSVVYSDSATCPYDHGAVSSRSTFFTGNAARLACEDAKKRIFALASIKLDVSPDKLDTKEGKVFIKDEPDKSVKISDLFYYGVMPLQGGEVTGSDCFFVPMAPESPENLQSERVATFYSHFAHAVEVAVNVETGEVKVLRVVCAGDMGTPINPKMAEAQMEGGFQQGIGTALFEHIVMEDGVVVNPNFADYKIPTARELPSNKNTKTILAPAPHPEGPFGAKGLGEGVVVALGPAIGNAVYDAVGIRVNDMPITREKVWKALQEKKGGVQ